MYVLKFGGTSVGSPQALGKVVEAIEAIGAERVSATVVSAFSGVTNQLIEAARLAEQGNEAYENVFKQLETRHVQCVSTLFRPISQSGIIANVLRLTQELESILQGIYLLGECTARSMDLVMSFGERLSAYVVKELLEMNGIHVHLLDARSVVCTDANFGNARLDKSRSFQKIQEHFAAQTGMAVVTGFIASTQNGETTTLGRGGSDFTASIIAAGTGAKEIIIYTDVDGMMTCDPRVVRQAFTIPQISYQEAMELSHFGAKVIYPPTLQPAVDLHIPIRIANTFNPSNTGTLITEKSGGHPYLITGLASVKDVSLVNVQGSGLAGSAGFAGRLFSAIAREGVNIILITQASSEYSISFAIASSDVDKARISFENEFRYELMANTLDPISVQSQVAIVAMVGENMKQTPGVSGRIFGALGRNGINIMATAQGSSELNISVVLNQNDLSKALNALHQAFFTSDLRQINLYLVGPGLIGGTLLKQIEKQQSFLRHQLRLEVKLVGIANTRRMWVDENGIDLAHWDTILNDSNVVSDLATFCQQAVELNLPNSVVADCTSSNTCIPHYAGLLRRSIAVVTPNKQANSGSLLFYKELQKLAVEHNTHFGYETNVGAGLPVIQTLKTLISSGDEIHRIEGMLSGTLSFIFNTFKPGVAFWEVVQEAKNLGYTEPDPRDDLSGRDIARKMLILARETGLDLEPEDVESENFLPQACLDAPTVDAFFDGLKTENAYFEDMINEAEKAGKRIKFICKLEGGSVAVKLEKVGPDHPFWNTSGADNILAFYTARYATRPMVIQGPGAGAEVTAAGVFGEIIALAG